jgi:alpha-ketoglutarate-dependent taurine dioxygenase
VPLNDADKQQLHNAFNESAVLVISDLELTDETHIELTRQFGDTVNHPLKFLRDSEYPEIVVLSTSPEEPVAEGDATADEIVAYSA